MPESECRRYARKALSRHVSDPGSNPMIIGYIHDYRYNIHPVMYNDMSCAASKLSTGVPISRQLRPCPLVAVFR